MKILCYSEGLHHKNLHALQNYKSIDFYITNNFNEILESDLSAYDVVYSPSKPLNVIHFPDTKFIFGPHFSNLPKTDISHIKQSNSIYIQPSNWAVNMWKKYSFCNGLKIKSLPFGVDTDKFNQLVPICNRNKGFIYFKNRDPLELQFLEYLLSLQNIEYKLFDYQNRYDETDYLDCLQKSKFGIWLGCHESQGFALQEALSCNVPLFVWSVKSMNQEYGCNYDDIHATTIPYWNDNCGEYVYDIKDFQIKFNNFLLKIENYQPRQFILDNLSINRCEQLFIDMCNQF
jgi:hypothetical protein